jgi:hypothetical protein
MKNILWMMMILMVAGGCTAQRKPSQRFVTVDKATLQVFAKGIQQADGKHAGTGYTIEFQALPGVEITALYIAGNQVKFEQFEYNNKRFLAAVIYKDSDDHLVPASLPVSHKGAAMIYYQMNDRKYYTTIEAFEHAVPVTGK